MSSSAKVTYTTVLKAGQKIRVPANRDFYVRYLIQSKFHARIAALADRIEILIKERGAHGKFDRNKFYEAAGLSIYAHRDQTRRVSGMPYVDHPITLVERAVDILHVTDGDELIAGLLHDVIEDTEFNAKFIKRRFGAAVANLVDGMTKIKQLEKDRLINEENIDKFMNALTRDIRVLHLKMIDRGINLEDAESLNKESRERNCREALDFYVPLGILCGFMKAARHLSDVAYRKLQPQRYSEIQTAVEEMIGENRGLLDNLKSKIDKNYKQALRKSLPRESLCDPHIRRYLSSKSIEVLDKPRTVYEVDQIATMRGTDARNLSDIVMMQVIVDSENDCYTMLDIIHSLGIPIDRYSRDYIKDPKINEYQSLHTGILVGNSIIRFQIRTRKMQRVAQDGVLYNAYTANGTFRQPELPWLRADWLRIILRVGDRRAKIILTKSFAQARLASVQVEGSSMCTVFPNVLLPRGITPLEIAFITDPYLGLLLQEAFHQDIARNIKEPIVEGIGVIKLKIADDVQYRDYVKLLGNRLARLKYVEFLRGKGEQYQMDFVSQVLESRLSDAFFTIKDLEKNCPAEVAMVLSKMAEGKISAEDAAGEIVNMVKEGRGELLSHERLELRGEKDKLYDVANTLRELSLLEGSSVQGPSEAAKLGLSIAVRSPMQAAQFGNFLSVLDIERRIEMVYRGRVCPPILDNVCLNPHSIYYSHDLALRAALALQAQEGFILDINLNPLALSHMPEEIRESSGLNNVISQHIANAGIMVFNGHKWDVEYFESELRKIVGERDISSPLFVVFERKTLYDVEGIIKPLTEVVDIPSLAISEMGHATDFLLKCLSKRLVPEE